jgi:hypothetical protein
MLIFLRRGVDGPTPNIQTVGPPLVVCPRLLIQYIRSNTALLAHAVVVTRVPLNMALECIIYAETLVVLDGSEAA